MTQFTIHVCLLLIGAAIVIGQTCTDSNAHWDDCGPGCKDYCTKDPSEVCTAVCVPGCFCNPGYRYKGIDSDECVPEDSCPTCGANKVYKTCGTACPDYCGKPPDMVCPAVCVEGCFCKDGYVQASSSNTTCIPQSQCS